MRPSVYRQDYKGIGIMADCRLHEGVVGLLSRYSSSAQSLLDIACGQGALAQRIKDSHPHIGIDVNDSNIEQLKFTDFRNTLNVDLNG